MTNPFDIRGDEIWFRNQPVAAIVIPEGTLRGDLEDAILHGLVVDETRGEAHRDGYDEGYAAGYDAGYDAGRRDD